MIRLAKEWNRLYYLETPRPDIAYTVSVINQFMHSLKEVHLQVANLVLQYFNGFPRKGILFK